MSRDRSQTGATSKPQTHQPADPQPPKPPAGNVSRNVAAAIFALDQQLRAEYGYDYAFTVLGHGHILGASNAHDGRILPKADA